ncbi:hypothetical protein WJX72_004769 [[Myrmecia] bisecta]|uniref:Uncharacterized protein n=1 Tax=[Myrmecia] bisecta TaxID=41462 RepID=A0AAW1PJT7_9CHLO
MVFAEKGYVLTPHRLRGAHFGALNGGVRGKSPRLRMHTLLAAQDHQCEELRKKVTALQAFKVKAKAKFSEAAERNEELRLRLKRLNEDFIQKEQDYQQSRAELERYNKAAHKHASELATANADLRKELEDKAHEASTLRQLYNEERIRSGQQQRVVLDQASTQQEQDRLRSGLEAQVKTLQADLQSAQAEVRTLRSQLQQKCVQLETQAADHKQLLAKYKQLTGILNDARSKLDTACLQSGKTIAADETKRVFRRFSQSSIASSIHAICSALPSMPSMKPAAKPPCEADCKAGISGQGQSGAAQPSAAQAKAGRHCRGGKAEPSGDADCAPLIDLAAPELKPASEYASAKELRKATKGLLRKLADQAGSQPGGKMKMKAFYESHQKPDWWPLQDWDSRQMDKTRRADISAIHDAVLVRILSEG